MPARARGGDMSIQKNEPDSEVSQRRQEALDFCATPVARMPPAAREDEPAHPLQIDALSAQTVVFEP
jgi:hypothetical protein